MSCFWRREVYHPHEALQGAGIELVMSSLPRYKSFYFPEWECRRNRREAEAVGYYDIEHSGVETEERLLPVKPHVPTTGLIAVASVLNTTFSRLYLAGFSGGTTYTCLYDAGVSKPQLGRHNLEAEAELLHKFCTESPTKISVDPHLTNLFKERYDDNL
jgi:hypothetical protein